MTCTRREFGALTLGGLMLLRRPLRAAIIAGVRIGVQTYSFRTLPRAADGTQIEPIITAMRACGLDECELFAPMVEPVGKSREDMRAWRLQTPMEHFRGVGQRFSDAGIAIYAYNYSPNATYTDEEIDRGFEMAKALGADIITSSTTLDVARRIAPFADKHRMMVAMHGHSNVKDPNEFATPESFAAAMKLSEYFKVNLDIGHFTAANFDAVAYIGQHHADITNIHLKDRRKNQGDNVPWGEGETPIREVLQLLQRERWPIRAYIEYEYRGQGTPVEEVTRCLSSTRRWLDSPGP